jgi:iron complex outermembrane receptor protein
MKINDWSNRPSSTVDQFIRKSLRAAGGRARFGRGALTVGLALSLGAGTAMADESPAPSANEVQLLEEIVVTAQFRQQNLETTPVAITALNAQQLDDHNAINIHDLNGFAPNVVLTKGTNTNGPSAQAFIRGIGQSDGHPGLEPGVGMYVDDVYHGLLLGSDVDLTDMDRVEILRGPQGTLAGKNSIGGSIKLFTKRPTEETDGYADVTYGDFNLVKIRAAGNFTLAPDTLYARVSGISEHQDGYLTRLDYFCVTGQDSRSTQIPVHGCKLGTEGGTDLYSIRLALRWVMGESVEDNFTATDTQDRSEVPALKLTSSALPPAAYPAGYIPAPLNPTGAEFLTPAHSYTSYATYANVGFTDPARFLTGAGAGTHDGISLPTNDPINYYGLTNNLTWKIGDSLGFTSITGYLRYSGAYSIETGDSPYPTGLLDDTWADNQFTQEFRLYGTTAGQFDWTGGIYYYKEYAQFGGLKLLNPGLNPALPGGTVPETLFTGNDPIKSTNKSVFLHDVWRATDALSLITGARYTKEDKSYTFSRLDPYALGGVPSYNPVGALNNTTGTYAGSHVDYRVGVEYQWTQSVMTYAEWSTGFRGGGVNPRPFVSQEEVKFGTEKLSAYELGLKSDLFDNHLRLNVAGFFNKYKDILLVNTHPLTINGVPTQNSTPVNVGAADVKGAEAELVIKPVAAFQIDGSVSYLNFKFTSINQAAATIPNVNLNTQDPYVPNRMATIGSQYTWTMASGSSLTPRLDARYQAGFFTELSNNPLGHVGGRTLADFRLTWKSPKGEWQTTAAVQNLSNHFYYISKVYSQSPSFTQGQPGEPREWLVTVRRNF